MGACGESKHIFCVVVTDRGAIDCGWRVAIGAGQGVDAFLEFSGERGEGVGGAYRNHHIALDTVHSNHKLVVGVVDCKIVAHVDGRGFTHCHRWAGVDTAQRCGGFIDSFP